MNLLENEEGASAFDSITSPSEETEGSAFDVLTEVEESGVTQKDEVLEHSAYMTAITKADPSREDASLMAFIQENAEEQFRLFKEIGDSKERESQAFNKQVQQVEDLVKLSIDSANDAELAYGAQLAAKNAAQESQQEPQKAISLEQNVASFFQANGVKDPHQVALFNADFSVVDRMKEDAVRDLMTETFIKGLGADERSVAHTFFDGIVSYLLFPFDEGTSSTGLISKTAGLEKRTILGKLRDVFDAGDRQEFEAYVISQIPLEDYSQFLKELEVHATKKSTANLPLIPGFSSLTPFTNIGERDKIVRELVKETPSRGQKAAVNLADMAVMLPPFKSRTIVTSMVKAGDRAGAEATVAFALKQVDEVGAAKAAKSIGLTEDGLIETMIPSSQQAHKGVVEGKLRAKGKKTVKEDVVSIASGAHASFASGERLTEEAIKLNASTRLNFLENEAILKEAEKASKRFFKDAVRDTTLVHTSLPGGSSITHFRTTLGSQTGTGGFLSRKGAERAAKRQGFENVNYSESGGQWFFDVDLPIREDAFYVSPLRIPAKEGIAARWISHSSTSGDRGLEGAAQMAGRNMSIINKAFESVWVRNNAKLSGGNKKTLNAILEKNTDDSKWLNPQELAIEWEKQSGKKITKRAEDSYNDQITMMDMEFFLVNAEAKKIKTLAGLEQVSFPSLGELENAKITRVLSEAIPEHRMFDMTKSVHWNKSNPLTPEKWAQMKKDGYIRVQVERSIEMPDGTMIQNFVGMPKEFRISPLDNIQIPYRAGPHRDYVGKWFSKSARYYTQPDTGTKVLMAPQTFRVFPSAKRAQKWNAVMNEARLSYLEHGDDAARIDAIFDGRPEFPQAQQLIDDFTSKRVDPDQAYESISDMGLPKIYTDSTVVDKGFLDTVDNPLESLARIKNSGSPRNSRRGERLPGYDGNPAPVLSPSASLARSSMAVTRLTAFSDYKIQAAQRFAKTFEKHFDDSLPIGATAEAKVLNGRIKPQSTAEGKRLVPQFEVQQAIIKRNLNQPSAWDKKVQVIQNLQDNILGGTDTGIKFSNWLTQRDPFGAMQAFAFSSKLGLGNVVQFPMQASTSGLAAFMSPKYAKMTPHQAHATGIMMRFFADHPNSAFSTRTLERKEFMKALGFKSVNEAKEMASAYANSGWKNIKGSQALKGSTEQKTDVGFGRARLAGSKTLQVLATPFDEAEKWNRGVAFAIAWREAQGKIKDGTLKNMKASGRDPHFMQEVMHKTDVYSFSMTKESQAAYQKGILSVPSQFLSYQLSSLEMLVGKKLTLDQKLKLSLTQTLLAGSSGVIGAKVITDKLQDRRGSAFEAGTAPWVLTRGGVDSVIFFATKKGDKPGADVKMGGRIGVGDTVPELARTIFGWSSYETKTFADVLGGPSIEIAKDVNEDMHRLFKWGLASEGHLGTPLTKRLLLDVAENIASVNNVTKAYYAFKYNQEWSNGGYKSDEVITPEAYALAIGIGLGTSDDIGHSMAFMQDNRKVVEGVADMLTTLYIEYANFPGKEEKILAEINSLRNQTDTFIWQQANEKAKGSKKLQPALDLMNQRVLENQSRRELFEFMDQLEPESKE